MLENARRYRLENPEKVKADQAAYYQKVIGPRKKLDRKLLLIEAGKWPPKPKAPKPEPKKRFVGEVKQTIKHLKNFPDISTIADVPISLPSSGKVEQLPGIFLDWHNL